MKKVLLYIHGKGGNADESQFYQFLCQDVDIIGLDYHSDLPWEVKEEILNTYRSLKNQYDSVSIIGNSIGAYFAMNALSDEIIENAYFISPIVNMIQLIEDMMLWANVTKKELEEKQEIVTDFGETLSWTYYTYAKEHPIQWHVPTYIAYGQNDNLTSLKTITDFCQESNALLSVMEDGEHWFHTDDQMKFLEKWFLESLQIK